MISEMSVRRTLITGSSLQVVSHGHWYILINKIYNVVQIVVFNAHWSSTYK